MPFYERFQNSSLSFRERNGAPGEFEAALGLVVINFQELEAVIEVAIASRLHTDSRHAAILKSELPFKKLVHILGALTRDEFADLPSKETNERLARLDELLGLCFFLEGERNRLIHSFWPAPHQTGVAALRLKRATRKDGLREQRESVEASALLDIADYAAYVTTELENYYDLDFGAADSR
jgi:hypothetical protein